MASLFDMFDTRGCLQTEIYSLYGANVRTVYIIKCFKIQKTYFNEFSPKNVGCGVTLSVKKISVTFVTCVRVRATMMIFPRILVLWVVGLYQF